MLRLEAGQPVHERDIGAWDQVAVSIDRDLDRTVPDATRVTTTIRLS